MSNPTVPAYLPCKYKAEIARIQEQRNFYKRLLHDAGVAHVQLPFKIIKDRRAALLTDARQKRTAAWQETLEALKS